MLKKFSNTQLIIGLVLLVGAVVVIKIIGSDKNERTFRSELVDIDTATVTAITIYPKSKPGEEVKLIQDNTGNWQVKLAEGGQAPVNRDRIKEVLLQLINLKPKRLAARSEDKWPEYEVTEAATRVKVSEDGETTLDLLIGKFSFQQQTRSMSTYVRLVDEPEVYVVDGALGMSLNQGAEAWRDKTIIKADFKTWTKLDYQLPAGSSYAVEQVEGRWLVDGQPADSMRASNCMRGIANTLGQKFMAGFDPGSRPPAYQLTIEQTDGGPITVQAYQIDSLQSAIHSSQNPEAWFLPKAPEGGAALPQ